MNSATPLWTSNEIVAAAKGTTTGSWVANGVSIDSRTIEAGDLFIALRGPNFDGHKFVSAALAAGASAALVDTRPDDVADDAPLVQVSDTLEALNDLGRFARDRTAARVIAVTGSVGKTGTKDALRNALAAQGKTHASSASHNNHWGVPLSLARMAADTAFGVFEIGMNHAGEITPLTKLVRPHVAIITTIAPAHIEFLGSIEAIADAKAEIFTGLEPGGTAVLNGDNEQFDRLKAAAENSGVSNILMFGSRDDADARLISFSKESGGNCVEAMICGRRIGYCLSLPGKHLVMNSLAVLAAIHAAGADVAQAAKEMGSLRLLPGRGQRHDIPCRDGHVTLIDESYNANPASMQAAIETLAATKPGPAGRRIAVLGDMRELGPGSEGYHREIATILTDCGIDKVFTAGERMGGMYAELPAAMKGAHAEDADALSAVVEAALRPGDVVVVKGSFASGMSRVVAALLSSETNGALAANG